MQSLAVVFLLLVLDQSSAPGQASVAVKITNPGGEAADLFVGWAESHAGPFVELGRTDEKGELVAEVPAGLPIVVVVGVEGRMVKKIELKPFADGERREVEIELVTTDFLHWVKVVNNLGKPVLCSFSAALDELGQSDAGGHFGRAASGRTSWVLLASGYERRLIRPRPGHETREKARTVCLDREAVVELAFPTPGSYSVQVFVVPGKRPGAQSADQWIVRGGFDRVVRIRNLPPSRTLLLLVSSRGAGASHRIQVSDLEAGGKRRLDMTPRSVRGVLTTGRPPSDCSIVIFPASTMESEAEWILVPQVAVKLGVTVQSKGGEFSMRVPEGEYWIGVSPGQKCVPVARRVTVSSSGVDVQLDIAALGPTGSLRGAVTDSHDRALPALIGISYDDELPGGFLKVQTDENGRFELSDLPCGHVTLRILCTESMKEVTKKVEIQVGRAAEVIATGLE